MIYNTIDLFLRGPENDTFCSDMNTFPQNLAVPERRRSKRNILFTNVDNKKYEFISDIPVFCDDTFFHMNSKSTFHELL